MSGKRTSQYQKWVEREKTLKMMPYDLCVVNTGSTPSYKAYDYGYWNVRGANMAFQPQPLYYDFEMLKRYSAHIRKGAIVLLGIEEFKLLVDAYEDEKSDHKYYLWLDRTQIRTYKKSIDFLMHHCPAALYPRWMLHDIKVTILEKKQNSVKYQSSETKESITEEEDIKQAQKWALGWEKEFGWTESPSLTVKQRQNININKRRLEKMIVYCKERGWLPYLVVPPFSPNLKSKLPDNLLEECLWKPLKNVAAMHSIKILDLYHEEKFADYRLYEDALTLNERGRKEFNRFVQDKINFQKRERAMNECLKYTLRNGVEIPWISFGTGVVWGYTRNKTLFLKVNIKKCLSSLKHLKMNRDIYGNLHIKRILKDAYDVGFRMYDSGRIYGHSEDCIGKSVSGRADTMVTTKCSAMDIMRVASPNNVAGNLTVSLRNLNRDKVDLYMLHWPEGDWLNYYKQIIDEYNKGRCRAFGACNMGIKHLKEIERAGLELPLVIQTEMHPLCARKELREYCREHDIQVMAHTATGHNVKELRESETMYRIAEKYHKSSTQIIIRWHYQNNVIPVISTFSKIHMQEDLDIFDFKLTEGEMQEIDKLDRNLVLLNAQGIDDPNYIYNY